MIRLSKKTDYALFLLTTLARREASLRQDSVESRAEASCETMPPVSAAELAATTGISASLTANLLKELVRGELLDSVRGQNGGYRLARRPVQITLKSIIEIVEGPIAFVECMAPTSPENGKASVQLRSEMLGQDREDRRLRGEITEEVCGLHGPCPAKTPLAILHNRIVALLSELTLQEIAFHDHPLGMPGLPSHGPGQDQTVQGFPSRDLPQGVPSR